MQNSDEVSKQVFQYFVHKVEIEKEKAKIRTRITSRVGEFYISIKLHPHPISVSSWTKINKVHKISKNGKKKWIKSSQRNLKLSLGGEIIELPM